MPVLFRVIKNAARLIGLFVQDNLYNMATVLNMILPFIMYFVGQYSHSIAGNITMDIYVCLPLLIGLIIYILKSTANEIGKGITIPVPEERFTQEDKYGEVSIENNRIQEMILYVADIEDWLSKRGML